MTTAGNIELSFFDKIYGTMSLSFTVEIRVYFICPLYITTIFSIHKLNCSLRNEIDRICCFLKTTKKLIIIHLKNRCISFDTTWTARRPWITYCSKRILQLSLHIEPDKAVFAIFALWFHVILRKTSCFSPNKMTFGNFGFMDLWMCSLRCLLWRQNRISSDSLRALGHVIHLLDIPISELGTRFAKCVELSH